MPSNLSTRLKQMEEQLGVELFVRERQRLQLSPAGKVLLDYSTRLLALHDEAHGAELQGGRTGGFVMANEWTGKADWGGGPPLVDAVSVYGWYPG